MKTFTVKFTVEQLLPKLRVICGLVTGVRRTLGYIHTTRIMTKYHVFAVCVCLCNSLQSFSNDTLINKANT